MHKVHTFERSDLRSERMLVVPEWMSHGCITTTSPAFPFSWSNTTPSSSAPALALRGGSNLRRKEFELKTFLQ